MTQNSRFWNGTTVGDASEAPYDAPDEFAAVLRSLNGANANSHRSGVCRGELNELAVTAAGGVSPISVNTGRAFVHGTWFENDAAASFNIDATPATQSRIDLVVLRKTWATQQVRLAILKGVDAVVPVAPTPTQSAGVTWEFPIYQITIVPAGTLTIDDVRQYVPYLSAQTFEFIGSVTLAAPDDIISFDISGDTHTLYVLVATLRNNDGSAGIQDAMVYFNAGDATGHDYANMQNLGAAVVASQVYSTWGLPLLSSVNNGAPVDSQNFTASIAFLFNLHSATQWKKGIGLGDLRYSASVNLGWAAGVWRNTSAVTLINIADRYGDLFMAGSKVSLYGVL